MHQVLRSHFPYAKPRTPLARPAGWTIANGHGKTKVAEGRHYTLSQGAKPLTFSAEMAAIEAVAGQLAGGSQGGDWGRQPSNASIAGRGLFEGENYGGMRPLVPP